MLKKFFFIVFFTFTYVNLYSIEEFSATAKLDSNEVLIGRQVNLNIELLSPDKVKILWADVLDSLNNFEIIEDSGIQKSDSDSIYKEYRNFIITSFDSGAYEIPSFTFVYEKKGFADPFIASSNPLELKFISVEVDTNVDIMDIKGPLDSPLSFEEILPYLIAVLAIAAIIFGVYYFLKKRKVKKPQEERFDPKIPPHVWALESLRKLAEKELWQNDRIKEYYIELSSIVRIYIERRYELDAMEMVTDEILQSLQSRNIKQENIDMLERLLRLADLAKFAKYKPLLNENSGSLELAETFVNKTKIEIAPIEIAPIEIVPKIDDSNSK